MCGCTKRAVTGHLNRPRFVNTVSCDNGCMKCRTLMTLSLKLSTSWRVPTKLAMLVKSLPTTLSIISNMLNHASVVYHTLESATNQNKISCDLLKIPHNPLPICRILSNSVGILDNAYLDNS